MMCQRVGVRILATVVTLKKKAFLINEFGINENQIFYSRDTSFKAGIMRATKGVVVIENASPVASVTGIVLFASEKDTFECFRSLNRPYLARQEA
jgi:hypothetical protein